MKNNQQKNGKKGANLPLSKKQRKKLEKSGLAVKTRAPREKMAREKKWLISLVAAICVMAIACCSFGSILLARVIKDAFNDPYASVFEEINLKKHIDMKAIDRGFYTGNPLDMSAVDEAYKPMTLADMDEYIEDIRIQYATLDKEMQKDREIGLADRVSLYVVDVFKGSAPKTPEEEKANRLTVPSKMEELFGTYASPVSYVVGGALFGEDFDKQFVDAKLKPIDTVRELRENNKQLEDGTWVPITEDDTVCITYYFQKSKGDSSTPYATDLAKRYNWPTSHESEHAKMQARVKISELDDALKTALLDYENHKAIGESFTFVLEDYVLGNNSENAYKVTAQVLFAVKEEVYKDITFTVPEGYFGESDGDFYALNGKTATMRVYIACADDYNPADFNRQFITETLKMEIAAGDDAGAVEEYKQKQLEKLNQEIAESKILAQYDSVISQMAEKAINGGYFFDGGFDADKIAAAIEAQITRNLLERFLAAKGHPPTTAELDEYAVSLAKMEDLSISSASQYIGTIYSSQGEQMKKTELLVYAIFELEKLKITDEALDAAYAEYMEKVTGSMWDKETHNEEYFLELYGEETIKSWVRRDLVYKTVGEYLLSVNSYNK